MKFNKFEYLPNYLKDYLKKFGWSDIELENWLNEPVPALGNKSIFQAMSDGQREQVNRVVLRVGDALGVEGYFE